MEATAGYDDDGASKKTFISNNQLIPASMHKVLSNNDLLMQILLLLPLLSLKLFKSVSKRWLSLITSPSFILRRNQISGFVPPSGVFIGRDTSPSVVYDFISFGSRKIFKRPTLPYNSETSTKPLILQSCNGLLLCYDYNFRHDFIYNPLISVFKILPPVHPLNYHYHISRLVFDPIKSPHYKVVHAGALKDAADVSGYSIKIQIYSSETGVWSVYDDHFPSRSFFGFQNGVYSNGAIHWLNNLRKDSFHSKLEIVDRLVLTNIQTPLTLEGEVHFDRKLFGSYGNLLLLSKEYKRSQKLNIYEMKNGYSEWSIKYIVNFDNMIFVWYFPKGWRCYNIWSIFFGEQEEDSFMVIQLSGKVLQYKFVSATVTVLLDVGERVRECYSHDFVPSFAHG